MGTLSGKPVTPLYLKNSMSCVTILGDLLDFGPLFEAIGNN